MLPITGTRPDDSAKLRTSVSQTPASGFAPAQPSSRVLPLADRAARPVDRLESASQRATAPAQPAAQAVSKAELLDVFRQMHALLRHGIPANRVFTALGAGIANVALAEALQSMGQQTAAGRSLSQAMAAWPQFFDAMVLQLTRHGEGERRLPACVKGIHAHLEFAQAMDRLEDQLAGKPRHMASAVRQELAAGRALACLSVGQRCGMPLDENLALAAQLCGDERLNARLTEAAGQPLPAAAASENTGEPSLDTLYVVLRHAGLVTPGSWRQALGSATGEGAASVLTALTQTRDSRAQAALLKLLERWKQLLKWMAAAGGMVLTLGLLLALGR